MAKGGSSSATLPSLVGICDNPLSLAGTLKEIDYVIRKRNSRSPLFPLFCSNRRAPISYFASAPKYTGKKVPKIAAFGLMGRQGTWVAVVLKSTLHNLRAKSARKYRFWLFRATGNVGGERNRGAFPQSPILARGLESQK